MFFCLGFWAIFVLYFGHLQHDSFIHYIDYESVINPNFLGSHSPYVRYEFNLGVQDFVSAPVRFFLDKIGYIYYVVFGVNYQYRLLVSSNLLIFISVFFFLKNFFFKEKWSDYYTSLLGAMMFYYSSYVIYSLSFGWSLILGFLIGGGLISLCLIDEILDIRNSLYFRILGVIFAILGVSLLGLSINNGAIIFVLGSFGLFYKYGYTKEFWHRIIFFGGLLIIFNIYWVVPMLFGGESTDSYYKIAKESYLIINNIQLFLQIIFQSNSGLNPIFLNSINTGVRSTIGVMQFTMLSIGLIVIFFSKNIKFKDIILALLALIVIDILRGPTGFIYPFGIIHIPGFVIFRDYFKFNLLYLFLSFLLFAKFLILSEKNFFYIKFGATYFFIILLTYFSSAKETIFSNYVVNYKIPSEYFGISKDIGNSQRALVLPNSQWFSQFQWLRGANQYINFIRSADIRGLIYDDMYKLNFNPNLISIIDSIQGEAIRDSKEIAQRLSQFNIDTLVIQKDKLDYNDFIKKNISLLERGGYIKFMTGNKIFDYYRVVGVKSNQIHLNQSNSWIVKINPTKYSLNLIIPQTSTGEELSFLQSFHNERKLYPGRPVTTGDCSSIEYYSGSQDQPEMGTRLGSSNQSGINLTTSGSTITSGDNYILTHITTTGESLRSILSGYGYTVDQLYPYNRTLSLYPGVGEELQIVIPMELVTSGSAVSQIVSTQQGSGSMTWGSTTECIRDGYTFFEGSELSYLWQQPLWDDTHQMIYDYANGRNIDLGAPHSPGQGGDGTAEGVLEGSGEVYLEQGLREGRITQNSDGSYNVSLTLYFRPQSRFYLGLLISGSTFIGLIGWLLRDWKKSRHIVHYT